ncbi:hypothetical protein Ancab_009122 [Ancistrocladus abbreviatus]
MESVLLLLLPSSCMIAAAIKAAAPCIEANCSSSPTTPIIRYPFRLTSLQPESCGYPSFDLHCQGLQTVLNLPNHGNFTVQNIDYFQQEIILNDPNNCLPKMFLSRPLDLSNSSFHPKHYQSLSLYNCSGPPYYYRNYTDLIMVECLSSSVFTVVVTITSGMESSLLPLSCKNWMADIKVPVDYTAYEDKSANLTGMLLGWGKPNCGQQCERYATVGGVLWRAGMAVSLNAAVPPALLVLWYPDCVVSLTVVLKWFGYTSLIVVGALLVCGFGGYVLYVHYYSRRNHQMGSNRSQIWQGEMFATIENGVGHGIHQLTTKGSEDQPVESGDLPLPLVIDERRSNLPIDNEGECRICHEEYQSGENLRFLRCAHYYHAHCINKWIQKCPTSPKCPACKASL